MGLDMYAYAADADLVGKEQIDIPVFERAYQKFGFNTWTDADAEGKTDAEIEEYFASQREALDEMEKQGILLRNFAYWRKFNHLHGWMENLYYAKGGEKEFNCTTVRLMPEDLDALESLASTKALQPTGGFFFGDGRDFDDDDRDAVSSFIANARAAIKDGKAILYDSWW